MSAVLHDIRVFFDHLADVGWAALGAALLCQFIKVGCVSRAWRNIIAASYPDSVVRWRSVWGARSSRAWASTRSCPPVAATRSGSSSSSAASRA